MKSGCSASSVLICQYQPEKGIVKAGSPRLAGADDRRRRGPRQAVRLGRLHGCRQQEAGDGRNGRLFDDPPHGT